MGSVLLCEPILTQQHADKSDHDQAMSNRHRVSQSSHKGGLASPTGRFQLLHRSPCEPILTQRASDQLNQPIQTDGTVTV